MFSAWSKSTLACSKHTLDEQAKKALASRKNSSGLYPGLAIIHNQASKESGAHLLSLPNAILVDICRYAVVSKATITVSISNPELCREPGLAETCKAIRVIAGPVFYRESLFKCSVSMFDVMALQPWIRKREKVMKEAVAIIQPLQLHAMRFSQMRKSSGAAQTKQINNIIKQISNRTTPQLPRQKVLCWVVDNNPDWENLVDWLKLYHQGSIGVYTPSSTPEPDQQILMSVFGIVRVLRGQAWSLVTEVLGEAKGALIAANPAWAAHDEDEDEDMDMTSAASSMKYFYVSEMSDDNDLN